MEKELETAFERAYRQKSSFLIPIRVDDAVMTTKRAWVADLWRTLNVRGFRNWSDAAFERAARMLCDLKSPG